MRIIDARSGQDVKVGEWVHYQAPPFTYERTEVPLPPLMPLAPGKTPVLTPFTPEERARYLRRVPADPQRDDWVMLEVYDRVFTASALIKFYGGRIAEMPLRVRLFHPRFLFQRVAFTGT